MLIQLAIQPVCGFYLFLLLVVLEPLLRAGRDFVNRIWLAIVRVHN